MTVGLLIQIGAFLAATLLVSGVTVVSLAGSGKDNPMCRYMLRMLLTLLAVASWLLLGCRQNPSAPVSSEPAAPPAASPKTNSASYTLEVRTEDGTSQATLSDNSEVTVGTFVVKVQDGQLTVNKRLYGKLRAGDNVLIQSDGQVLVNLEGREPWDKRGP